MENVSVNFTYNLPDEYTAQTNVLGLTANCTYEGPRFLDFEVQEVTGKILGVSPITPELFETIEDVPDTFHVLLDAKIDPLIASIFVPYTGDRNALPQKVTNLPDGLTFSRPDPQLPDHTYAREEIVYDFSSRDFKRPLPWFKPWTTWNVVNASRNLKVKDAEERIAKLTEEGADPTLISQWQEWKEEAENKIELYMATPGVQPFMVTYSPYPGPAPEVTEPRVANSAPTGAADPFP